MRHLKIYEEKKIFKKFVIDCDDINDPDETIYVWEIIKEFETNVVAKKLYTYFDYKFFSNADERNNWTLRIISISVIFESDDFDEVYEHLMMLINAKKYNL